MTMKTGIRFLALAWLLMLPPCLAWPHRAAAQTPVDPVATFDHDPMSVVVVGHDDPVIDTAHPNDHDAKAHSAHRRRTLRSGSSFLTDTPNYARLDLPVTIQVNVADPASNPTDKAVHLFFYRGFVREQKFKRKLNYDTNIANDYSIVPQSPNSLDPRDGNIINGSATFTVTFHLPAITPHSRNSENDTTEDDPDLPAYKGYRKIYIIATVLKNGADTKQYCFQTVTVYDYNKVPHKPALHSVVKHGAKPRKATKKKSDRGHYN